MDKIDWFKLFGLILGLLIFITIIILEIILWVKYWDTSVGDLPTWVAILMFKW